MHDPVQCFQNALAYFATAIIYMRKLNEIDTWGQCYETFLPLIYEF
jgi:hypothetical protein